jgi:hypothetical protein
VSIDDVIREFEKMKRKKAFDARLAQNIPLLSTLDPDDIKNLDIEKIEENVRRVINARIVRRLRDHGYFGSAT